MTANARPPGRALAIAYARKRDRAALAALLGIDDALADVLRTTREPMVGQMRLTWWHDALIRLDTAAPPAQPALRAAAAALLPRVAGADLATLVEGWEELLDPDEIGDAALTGYADRRGATLFTLAARASGLDADEGVVSAGRAWALHDLAAHTSSEALARAARRLAAAEPGSRRRWPRPLRPLAALLEIATADVRTPIASIGRLLIIRITGIPLSPTRGRR